jgi:competence protein ComEC
LEGTTATLAKALVLGNSGIQGLSLRQMAIESGCAHILALSGMHLHCIVLFMLYCWNKVLGKRIAQPLAIFGAILYVCLVGFKPSLVRAMVLLCLSPLRHRFPILQSLAVTFIVQIFVFPWTIYSTGALLSYCALFAIIVCSTPIAGVLSLFMPNWSSILFATTLSASLVTAPISLVVFGSWHVIGIVLSPLAAPLALLVLFCSLLWLVLPWPPIGAVAVQSTRAFLYLMEWGSKWSANHFSGDGISVWVWSTVVLLTATGILKYAGQTIRKRNRRAYDLGFSLRFAKRDHRIA